MNMVLKDLESLSERRCGEIAVSQVQTAERNREICEGGETVKKTVKKVYSG